MSSLRSPHGSSKMRSSHVRIHACSGDWALIRSKRSSSLATKFHAVGRVERLELGAELADDVVVALAELLADRRQLLAQQQLALLLVDALADVVADRLGDLQLGQVVAGPGEDRSTRSDDVDGAQHDEAAAPRRTRPRSPTASASSPGSRRCAGSRAGAASGAVRRSARAWRAARGWRPRRGASGGVAEDLGVGVGGATLGGVDGDDAGAGLDVDDGGRLAVRAGCRCRAPGRRRRGALVAAAQQERRPSAPCVAASTARRSSSVLRARVMTAPGSTVDGRWARGRRTVGTWRCGRSGGSTLMHGKGIDRIADVRDASA